MKKIIKEILLINDKGDELKIYAANHTDYFWLSIGDEDFRFKLKDVDEIVDSIHSITE
jgi:hypothetical protein